MLKSFILGLLLAAMPLNALGGQQEITLINPGFESGKAGWTSSGGTFAITSTAANVGEKLFSASWDASAASQTLSGTAVTVPSGLFGKSCSLTMKYKGGDSDLKLQVYNGSNVLGELALVASADYREAEVTFQCPSTGTLTPRLFSIAGTAVIIYHDSYRIGDNQNIGSVAQAEYVGSLLYTFAASCTWTNSSGGTTPIAFPANTNCNTPVVTGRIQTPSTKIAGFRLADGPGNYRIVVTASITVGSDADSHWGMHDGTSFVQEQLNKYSGTSGFDPVMQFTANYTSAFDKTFDLRASNDAASANTVLADNDSSRSFRIDVWKYPTSSAQALKINQTPIYWSGKHESNCEWSNNTTSFIDGSDDATCTFTELQNSNFGTVSSTGSKKPGITFSGAIIGKYEVCARAQMQWDSGSYARVSLNDGATFLNSGEGENGSSEGRNPQTLCGMFDITSVGQSKTLKLQIQAGGAGTIRLASTVSQVDVIHWTIKPISQSLPMPVITQSVVTSSAGQERIERVNISNSEPAHATACTTSPCSISASGSGISSVTRTSTGFYVVNFPVGAFSATPACVCGGDAPGVFDIVGCGTQGGGTTSVNLVTTHNNSLVDRVDARLSIICMGPRGSAP